MKIHKFGGRSLASAERIRDVATIIADEAAATTIIVVVAAIARTTDLLLESAQKAREGDNTYQITLGEVDYLHHAIASELFSKERHQEVMVALRSDLTELHNTVQGVCLLRELSDKSLAVVLSFGERLAARLISLFLQDCGLLSYPVDARELIVTDNTYADARVDAAASGQKIAARLSHFDGIPVVTGFIASSTDGSVSTLGRGGSDYTATLIGAALGVSAINIWTDVDGFFSADPGWVRDARVLPHISYAEAMELSYTGSRLLHPLAVQPAMKAGIPIFMRNSLNPEAEGTRIDMAGSSTCGSALPVTGLSSINKVVLLNISGSGMVGVPGIASRLFSCLARYRVNIIFISQASSEQSITLAISPVQAARACAVLEEEFQQEIAARQIEPLAVRDDLSMIAVVGNNMSGHPGVSAQLFETLGKNGINVVAVAQGASELNISFVIASVDENKALNCIHESFFLSKSRVHLFIVGTGTIAASLLGQLGSHAANLEREHGLDVVVCGMANTRQTACAVDGIALNDWQAALRPREDGQGIDGYIELIRAQNLHNTIVVDCTASAAVAALYPDLLQQNISVVTANKLGMAGPWPLYQQIRKAQRQSNARFLYETNVGAGLPIISTLNDLRNSGDNIISIEGVLSGTLSFIFNELRKGVAFSTVVRKAKEAGYTEPDPRDDLTGADFARKFLILGRELGYELEYADIVCQSLVPEELRQEMGVEEFLDRLVVVDEWYRQEIAMAAADGMTIAYAGEIRNGKATIGVKRIPLQSPIAGLNGSENMVVFTTDRYRSTPLVVKGPGAGGEVTAGGVFADILRVASYLI